MSFDQLPESHRQIRNALEARREELTAVLDRLTKRIRQAGSNAPLATESDEADPCDLDAQLVELTSAMVRRVDLALGRLREGRYGRCTRCGKSIGEARLRAMPFALRCRACESARERKAAPRAPQLTKRWDEYCAALGQSSMDEV